MEGKVLVAGSSKPPGSSRVRTRSLDKTARAHLAHRPEPDVRAPLLLVAPRAVLRGLAAGRDRLDLLLVVLALEPRQPSGDATMAHQTRLI
jgi:hypothetical protein